MGKFKEDVIRRNGQVETPDGLQRAKRAPMVETKRNKAAIRLALSSAYSFGVALPRRCCTARSKSLTSLCRSQSHPAQYVSGIPSAVILLSISHPIRVQLVASPTFVSASPAR